MRAVTEWRGKNDGAMPPPTVRLRIFNTHGGVCHLCGLKINGFREAWDASHVKSIWDGGENRETNLAPAHKKCHRAHTDREATERADANRKAMKAMGIRKPSGLKSRGFDKAPPQRTASRPLTKTVTRITP